MAVPIHITVENPDELLTPGMYDAGAVIRVQSGTDATQPGDFADLAGTGSTPTVAIVAGTRSYTAYDPAGGSSTWYRLRYENAGGTRTSDWSDSFQAGSESAGYICSIYDVEQRLTGQVTANNREMLLGFARDVTTAIEGYCGRWFLPRPLAGTRTLLVTPSITGRTLMLPKGVRSVTAIGYATTDQPDTGGSWTAITATDAVLRPSEIERDSGWPATQVDLLSSSAGMFYSDVLNGATITGEFGWAAPPADIAGIGVNVVVRRFMARGSGTAMAAATGDFAARLLRFVSPEDRDVLDGYRHVRI